MESLQSPINASKQLLNTSISTNIEESVICNQNERGLRCPEKVLDLTALAILFKGKHFLNMLDTKVRPGVSSWLRLAAAVNKPAQSRSPVVAQRYLFEPALGPVLSVVLSLHQSYFGSHEYFEEEGCFFFFFFQKQ